MQMERLACRNRIRKLLAKLLEDVEPEQLAAIAGHEDFPRPVILSNLLGEQLAEMYCRALGEMSRELVPQHMGQSELNDALWALFREVAANSASYHPSGRFRNRLYKFTQDVKRPLYPFEVAYSIGNLDLGGEAFSIGTVRFFTMDDNQATLWGLTEDNPYASRARPHWVHHPVAAVEVQAADDRRALETGLAQVTSSIDLLRFAGVRGVSAFDDRLFLWRLNGRAITQRMTPNQPFITYHWEHGFRAFITEMGSHIKKGLDPEVSTLQAIANGELPDEISRHLQRAINWISSSITNERLDDKVVDLCTALEVLLLPDYTGGRKGHVIALRHRLIGGDWNPIGILALYDLRSKIVHGSVLDVSQYLDYRHLLLICFITIDNLVNLAKRNPAVHNLKDLVGVVETPDNLKRVINLLDTSMIIKGKKAREIKSLAKKRLKELEQVA
jgi:hypothetical protein